MVRDFIHGMSMRPLIDRETQKLTQHAWDVISDIELLEKDPVEELKACEAYLNSRLKLIQTEYAPDDPMLVRRNPRIVGSKAWLLYMRKNIRLMIKALAIHQLDLVLHLQDDTNGVRG